MQRQFKSKLPSGSDITLTLKGNAFNIFVEPENNLWTYDLEGRLIGVYNNSKTYRRTLDNRFFIKDRYTIENEDFRTVEPVTASEAENLVKEGFNTAKAIYPASPDPHKAILNKIFNFTYEGLINSGELFKNIYLPISILPPDQYLSLVIQLTEGCNYNQCTFCDFYRDRPFQIKKFDSFTAHIKQVKTFFGESIPMRKSIFLADANAVVTPMNKLVPAIELIRSEFPHLKSIYSFIDVFTGLKKTTEDFKILNDLGLTRVYLGVESGHRPLLDLLKKPQEMEAIIELSNTLKDAGISIGIILLIGAGGEKFAKPHHNDSISLISRLPLSKGDMIYLSEFYETNKEYRETLKNSDIEMPTNIQIRSWANELKSDLKNALSKDVKVAVYDIKQFFY